MDLNIMRVTKIEVKKRKDVKDFSIRDIVFHNLEYDWTTREYFTVKTEVTCFLEDKDVAKLIYDKG